MRQGSTGRSRPSLSRGYSVPERVGGFGLLVAAAAAVWPTVTAHTGAGLPCPLRTLTGVPCPACGLTTAAVALVRGDLPAAVTANPVILVLAALTAAVIPLVALRAAGVLRPPCPWPPSRHRLVVRTSTVLATASWLYQLHRLGFDRVI